VRFTEGARYVRCDATRLAPREAADTMEAVREILAFEVLHRDIRNAFPLAVIENLNDVGAAQLRGRFGFVVEAASYLPVIPSLAVDELHRAERIQTRVLGEPNRPHAASP